MKPYYVEGAVRPEDRFPPSPERPASGPAVVWGGTTVPPVEVRSMVAPDPVVSEMEAERFQIG